MKRRNIRKRVARSIKDVQESSRGSYRGSTGWHAIFWASYNVRIPIATAILRALEPIQREP